jgi:hypothetical protein
MRRLREWMLIGALMLVMAPSLGAMQPAPGTAAQDGFVPVSQLPPATEQLPATPLVAGAYAFMWVATLAYVFSLWRRLAAVDRELVSLKKEIGGRP